MSRNSLGKPKKDGSLKSCVTDPRTGPKHFVIWLTDILDILNPTLYHKVKSIEIELGASDDEDILDKSIKVQTALPSRPFLHFIRCISLYFLFATLYRYIIAFKMMKSF